MARIADGDILADVQLEIAAAGGQHKAPAMAGAQMISSSTSV